MVSLWNTAAPCCYTCPRAWFEWSHLLYTHWGTNEFPPSTVQGLMFVCSTTLLYSSHLQLCSLLWLIGPRGPTSLTIRTHWWICSCLHWDTCVSKVVPIRLEITFLKSYFMWCVTFQTTNSSLVSICVGWKTALGYTSKIFIFFS